MDGDAERWRKLEVSGLADDVAREVYHVTGRFPKEELYGLTSQLRGAAVSVPTKPVEGYARTGDREPARVTDIALGSLGKTRYLLHLSQGLGFIGDADGRRPAPRAQQLGKKLWKFHETVRRG